MGLVGVLTPAAGGLAPVGTVPAVAGMPSGQLTGEAGFEPPVGEPTRLQVPALGVDAPVIPVTVEPDGGLAVPDDPAVTGWWHAGARPGSRRGTVVIDGHVDTRLQGPGVLFHLADLRPGDPITLGTPGGTMGYRVAAIRSYPKAQLPAEVFERAGNPRLVLITCGGTFNSLTRQYADNIVAYAVPATGAAQAPFGAG